jgi:hypothetical protein
MASLAEQGNETEHMRKKMVGSHKIDVVNPLFHHHGLHPAQKFVHLQGFAQAIPGDLIVLAKGAPERTPGEKNSPRTTGSRKRRFFTEMRSHVSDPEFSGLPAKAVSFACGAIHSAGPRAKETVLIEAHHIHSLMMQLGSTTVNSP